MKERLIGASILVALIVLVVPELLSGPKHLAPSTPQAAITPEPTRHVTVDLATSKPPTSVEAESPATQGSPASAASVATGTDASADSSPGDTSDAEARSASPPSAATAAPIPSAAQAPSAAISSTAISAPKAPAFTVPAPVESTGPSPMSSRASWAVQLGSFASRANAENLSHQLKGQGFAVYILSGGSGASVRYRVRVGPMADRDAAERTAAKLKSIGHVASLVAPTG